MKNNFMMLGRKWISLPLLLIYPIVIVALIAAIIIAFILPDEDNPIQLGLVDLEQSDETRMVFDLIDESAFLGSYIQIHSMTEEEANTAINHNELSSYILFPSGFTEDLYQGKAIEFPIIGNPNRPTESFLIRGLIDSVTRHIRASQANILTINHYAQEMGINAESRNDLLFEQFQEFLFYTMGRERIMDDREISNSATSSPISYYVIAAWFIIMTLWLLSLYIFLGKKENRKMKHRMKLYGVKEIQQIFAKVVVTLTILSIVSSALFYFLQHLLEMELIAADYLRIIIITGLYSILFLFCLAIIDVVISSQKTRLLIQSSLTVLTILFSGAIIPVIYFPPGLQRLMEYFFSNEAFHWLQEILLNHRLYADYIPLLVMNTATLLILLGISQWKERIQE
ncbi:ABC transporter permease [Virgibacillus ainsalahensis]